MNLPVGVQHIPELDCGTGFANLIAEGDNQDALMRMMPRLSGQVAMVYLDPPYNTGNSGMGYADARSRRDWEEFLLLRLFLAIQTLRDDGVMYISIDDDHALDIELLMNTVMHATGVPLRRLGRMIWHKSYTGPGRSSKVNGVRVPLNYRVDHEFVICYAMPKWVARTPGGLPLSSYLMQRREGNESLFDEVSRESHVIRAGFTAEGTKTLADILPGARFSYPKPVSLIAGLIECSTQPGDLVLDPFAGSGTTGHAVLSLNAQCRGDRHFVLCVLGKDEGGNIARDVCAERVRRVAEGYKSTRTGRMIPGLGGGFTYAVVDPLQPAAG